MRLNSDAFRKLIENVNSGTYRVHQDTPEYEKLIESIATRIIASIDDVNEETLIACLSNRSFTDHMGDNTIMRIVDGGRLYFTGELEKIPEIAATRVRGICDFGIVTLKDVDGRVYRERRLVGEFPEMTDAQRNNILNRIDQVRYDDYILKRQRPALPSVQGPSSGVRIWASVFALFIILMLWSKYADIAPYPLKAGDFLQFSSFFIAISPGAWAAVLAPVYLIFCTIFAIIKGRSHSSLQHDNAWIFILLCSIMALLVFPERPPYHHNPFFTNP